jgi:phosphoenolpyruvate-protein kinase (PTS system EI component)
MSHGRPGRGIAVLAVLALAATAGAQSDEGVKQVEELVKASGNTVKAIADTRQQLQKTMDVYNSLMADDATDRKKLYNSLQKEMANTDKRRAKIDEEAASMRSAADTLFSQWATSAAAIESPDLRKKSEDRLNATKASYEEIGTVGKKAGDLYEPFMKALQDQVTFLGHDLNPSAVASLKPEAVERTDMAGAPGGSGAPGPRREGWPRRSGRTASRLSTLTPRASPPAS